MTTEQVLLNAEARLGNLLHDGSLSDSLKSELSELQKMLHKQIEHIRGPMPYCYGNDDCSTQCMSTCTWRLTCGT